MKIQLVDLSRQHEPLLDEILAAWRDIIHRSGFILGKEVRAFEDHFAEFCEVKNAVGCASGTDALMLALKALGIGPGDEVITVSYTFSATVTAIELTGATPRLVDIRPDSYTIDTRRIESAITARTRAIIPVHLYGQPADMDPILAIAKRKHLFVVEDCAQAHGARYKGRRVGSLGTVGAFSFFPSKNLGSLGDAGACVTNDTDIAERIRRLRVHGRKDKHISVEKGTNSRIDTLQAAALDIKLRYLDEWNSERARAAAWYDARLGEVDGVTTPARLPDRDHVYHLYAVQVDEPKTVAEHLKAAGIGFGFHYPVPVHLMPAFENLGYGLNSLPVTERVSRRILSLPIYPGMSQDEVDTVCEAVIEALR
ncbi:MAG: DegT/DnrJ/EryC1/StrS family aminotransferase [Candidatus Hydrogenedentota bacterium]|nr:MAG: DegT/DnrJ/EryC1/StrS family aminotransferase [Candidatus Hydrogenedentota bacterium]